MGVGRSFVSSFIDSPPAAKLAMALCGVVNTMLRDYEGVKLGDITGMLESEIHDAAPNSDDESSGHLAICEAALCVEEAEAKAAAKNAAVARAKLALVRAKTASAAGSSRSRARLDIRMNAWSDPPNSTCKFDEFRDELSIMIGEGQADGATVPDPEPDPSLHPESTSPTLDEATLRQWSAANPQKHIFVPIAVQPQPDAEARLKQLNFILLKETISKSTLTRKV